VIASVAADVSHLQGQGYNYAPPAKQGYDYPKPAIPFELPTQPAPTYLPPDTTRRPTPPQQAYLPPETTRAPRPTTQPPVYLPPVTRNPCPNGGSEDIVA